MSRSLCAVPPVRLGCVCTGHPGGHFQDKKQVEFHGEVHGLWDWTWAHGLALGIMSVTPSAVLRPSPPLGPELVGVVDGCEGRR